MSIASENVSDDDFHKVEPTNKTRTRVTAACESCKRTRRKCNGTMPCENCEKRGLQCIYEEAKKRGPKNVSMFDELSLVFDRAIGLHSNAFLFRAKLSPPRTIA
jgi:hypothetical protein